MIDRATLVATRPVLNFLALVPGQCGYLPPLTGEFAYRIHRHVPGGVLVCPTAGDYRKMVALLPFMLVGVDASDLRDGDPVELDMPFRVVRESEHGPGIFILEPLDTDGIQSAAAMN